MVDENGYTTGYAYDAMARLGGIAYPAGDSIVWAPKAFEFRPLTASDWLPAGISAGQWRHYEGRKAQSVACSTARASTSASPAGTSGAPATATTATASW